MSASETDRLTGFGAAGERELALALQRWDWDAMDYTFVEVSLRPRSGWGGAGVLGGPGGAGKARPGDISAARGRTSPSPAALRQPQDP